MEFSARRSCVKTHEYLNEPNRRGHFDQAIGIAIRLSDRYWQGALLRRWDLFHVIIAKDSAPFVQLAVIGRFLPVASERVIVAPIPVESDHAAAVAMVDPIGAIVQKATIPLDM